MDGDAAIVAPDNAILPPSVEAALTGQLALAPGTAFVVTTSGSTGTPRAVTLSHAALHASTTASIAALGCISGDRWALALPLRHIAGLQVLARSRALKTDVHVVTGPGDPHAIAAAAEHAEHVALVPTQLIRCLDAGVDLSRFHSVLVGGGPLAADRAAQARTRGVALTLSYGMTETSGGCVYDGRALPGVEIAVEADGRIRLRGPMLASSYLPALPSQGLATAHIQSDQRRLLTPDGWFRTDDLGRLDELDGLRVLGRIDFVIMSGGIKVDPVAVEALLRSDPQVADVVVLGVPDPEWGERVVAVVVPADRNAPPRLQALRTAVASALPVSHAPVELRLTNRIQRDGLGKITTDERYRLTAPPSQ